MFNFVYDFIFTVTSLIILIKSISNGIYEIKTENNKIGGIAVITVSIFVVVFVNFIIWTK